MRSVRLARRYRDRLRELDLTLDNAAFYSPRERTILAGSDLNLFAERLAQVRREHERGPQGPMPQLDAEHAQKLATLTDELKAAGFTHDEITAELRQRKASWKEEMDDALAANVAAASDRPSRSSTTSPGRCSAAWLTSRFTPSSTRSSIRTTSTRAALAERGAGPGLRERPARRRFAAPRRARPRPAAALRADLAPASRCRWRSC